MVNPFSLILSLIYLNYCNAEYIHTETHSLNEHAIFFAQYSRSASMLCPLCILREKNTVTLIYL